MHHQIRRTCAIIMCLLLVGVVTAAPAGEVKRMALLVGNADYSYAPLKNPINDAADLNNRLVGLGFNTTLLTNPSSKQFRAAIRDFYRDVGGNSDTVSIFYYAGHAVQMNNVNYLIPVDAWITDQAALVKQSVSINELLTAMGQTHNEKNLVILDACRNNPFGKIQAEDRSRGYPLPNESIRELRQGLAPVLFS